MNRSTIIAFMIRLLTTSLDEMFSSLKHRNNQFALCLPASFGSGQRHHLPAATSPVALDGPGGSLTSAVHSTPSSHCCWVRSGRWWPLRRPPSPGSPHGGDHSLSNWCGGQCGEQTSPDSEIYSQYQECLPKSPGNPSSSFWVFSFD